MILLARLGIVLALLGAILGVASWRSRSAQQRRITIFLALSGLLGIAQAVMRSFGYPTGLVGNLWDLSMLSLLLPAMIHCMRECYRTLFYAMTIFAVVIWSGLFIVDGQLAYYDNAASLCFAVLLAMCSAVLGFQLLDDNARLSKNPMAWLAAAAFLGSFSDVIMSIALMGPIRGNMTILREIMVVRNAMWCLTYAGIILGTLTPARPVRKKIEDKDEASADNLMWMLQHPPKEVPRGGI